MHGYIMIPIRDFRVYRPSGTPGSAIKINRQHELEPLQNLHTYGGRDALLVDGVIALNGLERYIQGVAFETLAIEGYGDPTVSTVTGNISIQSIHAATKHVWYLLQKPAPDYGPYYGPFLWIADFAKYFVDYLAENRNVSLENFKSDFYEFTRQRHGESQQFQQWVNKYGGHEKKNDFRQAAVSYASFLWKESWSVIPNTHEDQFWGDINYIADEERAEKPLKRTTGSGKTLVTSYVFENFKHISQLTKFFEVKELNGRRVRAATEERRRSLGFTDGQRAQLLTSSAPLLKTDQLKTGDYVAVRPERSSLWKDGSDLWYAYIQNTRRDCHGERLDVIWLYTPSTTTLAGGVYPFKNELFLSSNCNCMDSPLRKKDVMGKVSVSWLKSHAATDNSTNTPSHFFIRQKFDTKDHCFTTIKGSDFVCQCRNQDSLWQELQAKVAIGDTILLPVKQNGEPSWRPLDSYNSSNKILDRLDPVVVEKYITESQTILVRRLIRRAMHSKSKRPPNELIWTEEFFQIVPELVGPKCHVRFYQERDQIPSPYNRNGTGNFWYITAYMTETDEVKNLQQPFPTGLNPGLDPTTPSPRPRMIGLDMFAGGGNFGRGIEDGMAVNFLYAIDWAKNAVLTYKSNCSKEHPCWVYWGSVNDYLRHVMDGNFTDHFARVGNIDFVAAGSPCQGFSRLQRNTASDTSLRNISMVASVAAYIDVYRPKYAILENVVAMAHRGKGKLEIFPQLLCALVGLGYQVSQHLLDAWSCGDSQRRSRLFVTIAAPGLAPMPPATLTHSHPRGTPSVSLGTNLANDQKFGERRFLPTPFQYVPVKESMGDLPNIQDSHIQTCITHPDHRTVSTEAGWTREMIRHIPIFPPVQSAMSAIQAGVMPQALAEKFLQGSGMLRKKPKSRSWSRIPQDGLTSTITTAPAAACAINGRVLHWQQHRVLSIREARRAQGFDDGEVIIGSPNEQWKIIGNSVSRSTALALGVALQEAWLANPLEDQTALPISLDARNEEITDKNSRSSSPDLLPHLHQAARSQPMHQGAVMIDLTQD